MPKKKKSLQFLFITDPLENFDAKAETTLFIMKEAQRRGHQVFATSPQTISARGTKVYGEVQRVRVQAKGQTPWYEIPSKSMRDFRGFDAILLRKDPPFDLDFLHHLYLLEFLAGEVYLMNHPTGILRVNEKIFPLPFENMVPETLISCHREELLKFVANHPKGVILKPLGGAGGKGVFLIRNPKSDNIKVLLETATQGYSRHIVAQTYRPEIKKGDKRILLLGGEVLGVFLRKASAGEHRANLHAGGKAYRARVSARERQVIDQLQPSLSQLGLDFVGLDFIGDYLIEVNVTSPMGINEINKTQGGRCETAFLDFLEERVKDYR